MKLVDLSITELAKVLGSDCSVPRWRFWATAPIRCEWISSYKNGL